VKVYLKELYTVVPIIGLGNNPYAIYFVVLQSLLDLCGKEDSVTNDDLLQILVIVSPISKK